jgi:predicted ABC-type exoprotein transport system permease subunit
MVTACVWRWPKQVDKCWKYLKEIFNFHIFIELFIPLNCNSLSFTKYSKGKWLRNLDLNTVSNFVNLYLSWSLKLILSFDLSWMVPKKRDDTAWLASQLSTLSCYYADHYQLIQALSFIKWSWLFSCFVEWDPASDTQIFLLPTSAYILLKIYVHAYYTF